MGVRTANLLDIKQSPRLVVFHERSVSAGQGVGGLRLLTSHKPFAGAVLDYLAGDSCNYGRLNAIAAPSKWRTNGEDDDRLVYYSSRIPLPPSVMGGLRSSEWLIVSNGRFFCTVNKSRLANVLTHLDVDVVAVNVEPSLAFYGEAVSHTSEGKVAGFRRSYQDSVVLANTPVDWPMHLLIRRPAAGAISASGGMKIQFEDFMDWVTSRGFVFSSVKVGGAVLDLEKEPDLLGVLKRIASLSNGSSNLGRRKRFDTNARNSDIHASARLFGRVVCGRGIKIGAGAVVSGPVMLGDDVKIGAKAVVRNSVVAAGLAVPDGAILENRVVENEEQLFESRPEAATGTFHVGAENRLQMADTYGSHRFKTWPLFSYAKFWKRLFDIITAVIVLTLFLPAVPFIALAIKFTSPGPVFFRDRRQGLYGRYFNCLKFRTMTSDASRLQEHLRELNQVEGPQFSIRDDPRTNVVGKFLRETFIDEVPQFFSVLLGRMSVIGPRPSPESENTQCPRWRDARLSVRPGITGMWQVCRTRAWGRDFQEWIKYDVTYVRRLSFKVDLWICWRTVVKILRAFGRQFRK